jgi:two-component system CheB/CheR fusion protein
MTLPAPVERMLRTLADVAREHVIVLLDPAGKVLWWNRAAENTFAESCESAVGKPLAALFIEEDKRLDLPALELEIARTNGAAENDRWLTRADGSVFWASGATTCLRDESGNVIGFGKILRNRTNIREQLDTFENTLKELRKRDEHRNAFLSTLSHELRNPLTPISTSAHLLRDLPPESPHRGACLDIIERQLGMMTKLVDDLLDVARIGAGKVQLDLRPAMLQSILSRSVDAVEPAIKKHRHKLEVLVPTVPITVLADDHRLVQVFTNLLANAVKYTPDGGNIWLKATVEGAEAVAHVEDTGLGISPDMLPRIFELFTQADVTRTRSEGGLGIGLALVRDLVRLHGGSVQVRSDGLGKGSEFTVRLPLRE